ncbi:hypothetical protein AcV7_006349 [Taiwanofungus camphoratus]|nr:hypothetical protein AcV7_006349 [Antrodia cinnamomea]
MTCTRCYDDIRATRPQANLAYANAPDFCQSKHCHKSPRHLLTWSATVIDSINRLLASTRGQHPSTWFPSALSAHPLIDTMSTHGSQAGPSSSGSGRAPRGSACLNCRRRKLRCDGEKPVCGQCIRSSREVDCEYTDGPTRSATLTLEDNITRLEARIYELEHPEVAVSAVQLHDPRSPLPQGQSSMGASPATPTTPNLAASLGTSLALQSPQSSSHSTSAMPPSPSTEPPPDIVQILVGHFLPHSSQVGFFLHTSRFLASVYVPDVNIRTARLSPALLNAVYLWGARLSNNDALRTHEPAFLSRAVQAASGALAHDPPYNITYMIQAEVLLATYFFSMGRFLEGRYHCSAAVALALSCRLNKIRAAPNPASRARSLHSVMHELPAPVDAIDEGERINAFWAVYTLDKSWAVAIGSTSHLNGAPGAMIDTPWPLEIEDYEHGGLPAGLLGSRTMQTFLHDLPTNTVNGTSSVALRAKAAAVFERATYLASQWTPNVANVEQFSLQFVVLDNLIDRFTASLLPIHVSADRFVARDLLCTHTLARVATIQLHRNFSPTEGLAESKELVAAKAASAVLNSVNLAELTYVDPIFAILWTAVCRTLIGESSRLRIAWMSHSQLGDEAAGGHQLRRVEAKHNQVAAALQKVMAAMASFSNTSPLMATQASIVQQEFEQATR